MKLNRLIGIISILLQKDKVTVKELAEKFEVSYRTVLRDIEAINLAGIPVATDRGKAGGVYIMENYKIDRTVLSSEEMQFILTGLQSLDSVSGGSSYKQLMEKLSLKSADMSKSDDTILIDLSGWDKTGLSEKIDIIKAAMEKNRTISFSYYAPSGNTSREIEPYHLIFQWSGWYVWGYCLLRRDYRMFKLSRLAGLKLTDKEREKRSVPEYVNEKFEHTPGEIKATVKFHNSVKWRLADEFENQSLNNEESEYITVTMTWSDAESFFQHISTFGDKAEIIAPREYREEFKRIIKKIYDKYLQ
ncbi:MAG TPA: DNA-binding transcriptional regulator [Ruminococcaceae bacterium]|nr:DNA-binding transcriptional regulator [Oscillospiraceae bacterium]